MDIVILLTACHLALASSAACLVAIVVGLGAVLEVCTGGAVNFGITTRPWCSRRS